MPLRTPPFARMTRAVEHATATAAADPATATAAGGPAASSAAAAPLTSAASPAQAQPDALQEQAVRFLLHPNVVSSPLATKRKFLLQRGLTAAQVEQAIRDAASRSPTAASPTAALVAPALHAQAPVQPVQPVQRAVEGWSSGSALASFFAGVAAGLGAAFATGRLSFSAETNSAETNGATMDDDPNPFPQLPEPPARQAEAPTGAAPAGAAPAALTAHRAHRAPPSQTPLEKALAPSMIEEMMKEEMINEEIIKEEIIKEEIAPEKEMPPSPDVLFPDPPTRLLPPTMPPPPMPPMPPVPRVTGLMPQMPTGMAPIPPAQSTPRSTLKWHDQLQSPSETLAREPTAPYPAAAIDPAHLEVVLGALCKSSASKVTRAESSELVMALQTLNVVMHTQIKHKHERRYQRFATSNENMRRLVSLPGVVELLHALRFEESAGGTHWEWQGSAGEVDQLERAQMLLHATLGRLSNPETNVDQGVEARLNHREGSQEQDQEGWRGVV